MTYPDFQREMGRCQVFCKNVPENLYIEICGGVLSRVTWDVTEFLHFCTLSIQSDFKCKMCLPKYDQWYFICKESPHTITWYEEKSIKNAHDVFYAQTNIPIKDITFSRVQCINLVYNVCFAGQIRFCCETGEKWRREFENSFVPKQRLLHVPGKRN